MQPTLHRSESQPVFILALLLLALVALGRMLEPFVGILLFALLIYIQFLPTFDHLVRRFPRLSSTGRSLIATGLLLLFILTPFVLIAWSSIDQVHQIGPAIRKWNLTIQAIENGKTTSQLNWFMPIRAKIASFLGMSSWDVQNWVFENVHQWIDNLDGFFVHAASNTLGLFVGLFLFLLILFYLFRDGPVYYKRLRQLLPLEPEYQDRLFHQIHNAIHIILRGWLLSALLQGGVAMLGYTIIQLPGAMFLGCLTAITSIIPYVGTAIVWVPTMIALFMQGENGKALFILLWGGGMVSLIDNFAAPLIIGQKTNMPLPFLLLAIVGGIGLFGFKGLLLGPLILLITPTILEIYRERFLARSGAK